MDGASWVSGHRHIVGRGRTLLQGVLGIDAETTRIWIRNGVAAAAKTLPAADRCVQFIRYGDSKPALILANSHSAELVGTSEN